MALRLGLQTKVLVPVVGTLVLLLGITLWLVNRHIRQEFRNGSAQTLATAVAIFQNSQKIRSKSLQLRFRNVPNEPRFKAVSQLSDAPTSRAFLTELLDELAVDAAQFTVEDGRVLAAAARTPAFPLTDFATASLASRHQAANTLQPAVDLVIVGGRFFDVVSLPTSVNGHLVGVLSLGVEMGTAVAQEFKELTHTEVVFLENRRIVVATRDTDWPETIFETRSNPSNANKPAVAHNELTEVVIEGEHFLSTVGRLASLENRDGFTYVLLSSCEQQHQVLRGMRARIGLIGLIGITVSTAILWLMIRGLTGPLRHLRDAAENLGRGDFGRRVSIRSNDECGELAMVFNEMAGRLDKSRWQLQQAHDDLELRVQERTRELSEEIQRRERAQAAAEEAHAKLLVTSRQAGMAEVATGVLHNVGNVLNSVNVSANLALEQVRQSRVASLARVVEMVREHRDHLAAFLQDDPKGQQLPPFLEALSEQLGGERLALLQELNRLQEQVDHIKQIVAMQQSYARVSGTLESVAIQDLVEDALRIASPGLARHHIEIHREFEVTPAVFVDRHKVLQILVNLFRNAQQALESRPDNRRLVVRVHPGSDRNLRVEVMDNGMGIPKENFARIFNHGFTTKASGHGFGLHSGANAAREMGGSLSVQSDGPGQGATFTLEIPMRADSGFSAVAVPAGADGQDRCPSGAAVEPPSRRGLELSVVRETGAELGSVEVAEHNLA